MALVAVSPGQAAQSAQLNQLINLLTGVMNDQPVTLKADNTRAPSLLTLDSVNAAQAVSLRWADAGTVKWTWQKDASNNFVVTGPAGGRLGIGAAPQAGRFINVLGSLTSTASAGVGYALGVEATLVSSGGSDTLAAILSLPTFSVGTGLTAGLGIGLYIPGNAFTKVGTGVITSAYGLYLLAPTIGAANYAAYFGGNVGIGTASPGNPLVVLGGTNLYAAVFDSSAIAAGSSYGIRVQAGGNSSDFIVRFQDRIGADRFYVRGDGFINFGQGTMGTAGALTMTQFLSAPGTVDATTYQDFVASSAGAAARTGHQTTLSIAATATAIISQDNQGFRAMLVFLHGTDGTNQFADLVIWTTGTVTTVSSVTDAGTPAARTYSTNANGQLKLAMASGTYRVNALAFILNPR